MDPVISQIWPALLACIMKFKTIPARLYLMVIPDLKRAEMVFADHQVSTHKISNFVRIRLITNRIFVQTIGNTNRKFGSWFFDHQAVME